jgi:hypothetical protein
VKRQIVGIHFERQLTQWEAFDGAGKLEEDEWSTDGQGKVYVTPIREQRLTDKRIQESKAKALEKESRA